MAQCKSLDEVRSNIDRLDRQIVPLLAERAGYVRQAASFKKEKAAVVDIPRIEEIILKVRHMANDYNADPDLIERIYRSMIDACIIFESHEWTKLNGDHAEPSAQ
jgi:isochorismate pyruvate lyase